MSPSDASGYTSGASVMPFGGPAPLVCRTDPENRQPGGFPLPRRYNMPGRPRGHESARRTRELLRFLTEGQSLVAAQAAAKVSDKRLIRLFDEPTFRAVATAILDGTLGPTAITVEPDPALIDEALAA